MGIEDDIFNSFLGSVPIVFKAESGGKIFFIINSVGDKDNPTQTLEEKIRNVIEKNKDI